MAQLGKLALRIIGIVGGLFGILVGAAMLHTGLAAMLESFGAILILLGLLGICGSILYPKNRRLAAGLLISCGILGFPVAYASINFLGSGFVGWLAWTFPATLMIIAGMIAWITPERLGSSLPLLKSDKVELRRAGQVLYAALLIAGLSLTMGILLFSGILFSITEEYGKVTEADVYSRVERTQNQEILNLTQELNDTNATIRANAAETLGRIEVRYFSRNQELAVGSLIQALQDEDGSVRGNAACALGKIKDKRAVDPLIQTLRDNNSHVRLSAASALGKLGDAQAVDPLILARNDENDDVRSAAEKALNELGWQQGSAQCHTSSAGCFI